MNRRHFFALAVAAAAGLAATSVSAQQLPEKFANDPVANTMPPPSPHRTRAFTGHPGLRLFSI